MKKHELGTQIISDPQVITSAPAYREAPRPARMGLRDLLYILFHHKKKIILFTLLGLIGAAIVFFNRPVVYESRAKLLVDYILSRSSLDGIETETGTGRSMASVLNAELEILTSWDLAVQVAETVGPERILPDAGDKATVPAAAMTFENGLSVQNNRNSQVITVAYRSADADLSVEILNEFVRRYFVKHLEVHRSGRAVEDSRTRVDEIRSDLTTVEGELKTLRKDHGVTSIDEQLISLLSQRSTLNSDLMTAQSDLVGLQARISAFEGAAGSVAPETPKEGAETAPEVERPSDPVIDAYRVLLAKIDSLNMTRIQILAKYKESSSIAKNNKRRLDAAQAEREGMLKQHPGLARADLNTDRALGDGGASSLQAAKSLLQSLQAKVDFLQEEKKKLDEEYASVAAAAPEIATKEQERQIHVEKLRLASVALEQAEIDQRLLDGDASQMPNIDIIQRPSVAVVAPNKLLFMLAIGLAGGGLALGIALAMLIELFLDTSIKRASEIESHLRLPLMLSIPMLEGGGSNGDSGKPWRSKGKKDIYDGASGEFLEEVASGSATRWDPNHFLRPFADAIRDRVGYQFDINGVKHKPKLIALTGFSDDAGTSTLAASLAASFAETIEGKVLFVDLNGGNRDEDREAREGQSEENLELQGPARELGFKEQSKNLFVATIPTQTGSTKKFMPHKLYGLLPQFRSSEFDYVIFDMPLIGPTSPTLSMAGFMDKVLLVVDAGKTGRETLRRSYEELLASNANVSTILNKTSESLPSWLQG